MAGNKKTIKKGSLEWKIIDSVVDKFVTERFGNSGSHDENYNAVINLLNAGALKLVSDGDGIGIVAYEFLGEEKPEKPEANLDNFKR